MPTSVYRRRNLQSTPYYQCIEDHFEPQKRAHSPSRRGGTAGNLQLFEQVYEDRFERQYGFFRPYVKQVIWRYLDCEVLKNGFACVQCEHYGHEYLLAFSCKRRHFCPSCHQKRVVEFGEWLCQKVVKAVPHRHVLLSIPKILRRHFLYNRKLLSELSRCGWESLKAFYTADMRDQKAVPGAVVAIQTFRDFPQGLHHHLHMLVSDGCFHENGMFSVSPAVDTKSLRALFS